MQTKLAISDTALLEALQRFREGDFSTRLPSGLRGVAGEIAAAFNACVDRNEKIAREFALLSRSVGRDGLVRKRASIDAEGQWRDAIASVNRLVDDLVFPMTESVRVLGAVARGDLSQRMPLEDDERPLRGEFLRASRAINTMVDRLNAFASEVTRVVCSIDASRMRRRAPKNRSRSRATARTA